MTKRSPVSATILVAAALTAPLGAGAVTIEIYGRSANAGDLSKNQINLADCRDTSETFKFKYSLSGQSTSGKELYVFAGDNCDTSDCGYRSYSNPADSGFVEIPAINLVLGDDASATDCPGSEGSISVWAALLDGVAQEDKDVGSWSDPVEIEYDMNAPDAPNSIKAGFGEQSVTVEWSVGDEAGNDAGTGSGEGFSAFEILCWPAPGTSAKSLPWDPALPADAGVDGSADSGADTDSDSDSDSDTDSDSDSDTGGGAAECGAAGGFAAGDVYDDQYACKEMGRTDRAADVGGLTNGTEYRFGVVALDDFKNPSTVSDVACATPAEVIDFSEAYDAMGGKGSGHYCFVATAAFGSYDHPVVRVLRAFRDGFLEKLPGGRLAIDGYYAAGPHLAAALSAHPAALAAARDALFAASGLALLLLSIGPKSALIALASSLVLGLVAGLRFKGRGRRA
jgi:hypothetical protein